MVLGEVLEPKPGPQEAARGPQKAKTKKHKILEIRFSECEESADTHHHHIYRDQDEYKNAPKRPQDAPPEG